MKTLFLPLLLLKTGRRYAAFCSVCFINDIFNLGAFGRLGFSSIGHGWASLAPGGFHSASIYYHDHRDPGVCFS
jgi:hypothetical protein